MFIDNQLALFKNYIETAIRNGGAKEKTSLIRSKKPINLIHDAIKKDLILAGINPNNIYPHFNESKPEIKIAGFLKQKDQDVCVLPSNIDPTPTPIDWGPLSSEDKQDQYGYKYSTNTLVINVRSQMSSIEKNSDTLFERTFAEALNLHRRYPDIVLGEVYLIPVHEYNETLAEDKQIGFCPQQTNLEKYISFFNAINNRQRGGDDYAYERCALLIVDFNRDEPYLFENSAELKAENYISNSFTIEYSTLNYQNFTKDILRAYAERFDINNLK